MTIYFMGGEMGAFIPSDATTNEISTTQVFNTAFARCSLRCGAGSAAQYGESSTFAAPDECYYHFEMGRGTTSATVSSAFVLVAGSTEVFRIRSTDTTLQMQALISAVWTNVGAAVTYDGTELQTVDLFVEGNNAAGTAALYLSGTERESATADLTAVTGVTKLRSYGINSASGHNISQVIVQDTPTIGLRLATYYMSGTGANTAWTGTYTGVDEIIYSDADFIYSDTATQVETFATTGPGLTGYTVLAVGVYARAKQGGSGPSNLQLALRVNGTDYFSASKALGIGYGAHGAIWETNPDTASDWLTTEIASIQPGVKSIT